MELMTASLAEAGFPPEAAKTMWEFFDGVATFMMNRE